MLDLIKKALKKEKGTDKAARGHAEERIQIAACVVLLEAAHVDNECTAEELAHVLSVMKSHFAIPHEYAEELVEIANRERVQAVDLWQFTNEINQQYNRQEKIAVMEVVWRIIHVDGQLEKHEDHFAHKMAKLLRLNHQDLIGAKLRAREPVN